MSNIQKTLDSLQPYVIGIRYLEGTPLVDAVFKEGWTVPDDNKVKKVRGNDEMNYYMLFSEVNGVGLDDLLDYVKKTIDLNIEREKKHDLLREKVNELKEIFKKNSLDKLKRLKFTFNEEDLVPRLDDFDADIEDALKEEIIIEEPTQTIEQDPSDFYPENVEEYATSDEKDFEEVIVPTYLDENGNPFELSEEELEMIEEEKRAMRNMEMSKVKKQNDRLKNISSKVELPPR
jgi:hypothetical protein